MHSYKSVCTNDIPGMKLLSSCAHDTHMRPTVQQPARDQPVKLIQIMFIIIFIIINMFHSVSETEYHEYSLFSIRNKLQYITKKRTDIKHVCDAEMGGLLQGCFSTAFPAPPTSQRPLSPRGAPGTWVGRRPRCGPTKVLAWEKAEFARQLSPPRLHERGWGYLGIESVPEL